MESVSLQQLECQIGTVTLLGFLVVARGYLGDLMSPASLPPGFLIVILCACRRVWLVGLPLGPTLKSSFSLDGVPESSRALPHLLSSPGSSRSVSLRRLCFVYHVVTCPSAAAACLISKRQLRRTIRYHCGCLPLSAGSCPAPSSWALMQCNICWVFGTVHGSSSSHQMNVSGFVEGNLTQALRKPRHAYSQESSSFSLDVDSRV